MTSSTGIYEGTALESNSQQYSSPIRREQRPDAIEFGRENLQHHKREGELAQRGPDVRAFKRSLRCADLYESVLY